MPVDWKLYPPNWRAVRNAVIAKSGGQCMCEGECGLHKTNPGPRRCEERNGEKAKWAKGKVVLTVAHLDHDGGICECEKRTGNKCSNPDHLKALCNRCHLRLDVPRHVRNGKRTREAKKWVNQLPLSM